MIDKLVLCRQVWRCGVQLTWKRSQSDLDKLTLKKRMLSNGADDMSANSTRQPNPTGARAKDDAMVAYLFQRPQAAQEVTQPYSNKRWAAGDEMVMEQVG